MSEEFQRKVRWAAEAMFFDREAHEEAERIGRTEPATLKRYGGQRLRRRFSKEFRFSVMGDLNGKSILDVGCGTGENAVLFAHLGARVCGIDVSPTAIEVGRKRAAINGLEDQTTFICAPVETAELAEPAFDVVWCNAFLHHVIDDMPVVLERLVHWVKPDGLIVLAEPTMLWEPLRRLRRWIPVGTDGTPDERPLDRRELRMILAHFRDPKVRGFNLFGRLVPYIVSEGQGYERSSMHKKVIVNLLCGTDDLLLSFAGMRALAGSVVVYGAPKIRC